MLSSSGAVIIGPNYTSTKAEADKLKPFAGFELDPYSEYDDYGTYDATPVADAITKVGTFKRGLVITIGTAVQLTDVWAQVRSDAPATTKILWIPTAGLYTGGAAPSSP